MEITLLKETPDGAVYRAALSGPAAGRTVEFRVSPEGALAFDNRQPEAAAFLGRKTALALAGAMAEAARARVPGALAERSPRGLAFELRAHYRAYRLGLFRRQAVTAELGSPRPEAPDYDHNAVVFEHPLRGLPTLLRGLAKKK